tara:strand:+ start:303 stop:653 length:351 start_codon:yes stop_codon:yes gene_type:complete
VKNENKNNDVHLLEELLSLDLKTIIFFQADLTKYKILLIVMKNYYKDQNTIIEKIIENLPSDNSSRAHKLNFITDATTRGYLIKETSKSDMRKKYLKPSRELIKEFNDYLKIFSRY